MRYGRGWRPATAATFLLLAVAGCGSGSHPSARAVPAAHTLRPVASAPAPSGVDAAAVRARAISAALALRSYRFDARQQVDSDRRGAATSLQGVVALPNRVTYQITVAGTTTSVVRVGRVAYARSGSGRWHRLRTSAGAASAATPTTTLVRVLRGLTGLRAESASSGGTVLTGTLPAAAVSSSGLFGHAGGVPAASVRLLVDRAGRVLSFGAALEVTAGGKQVRVSSVTTYSAFDHAPPVVLPKR